MKGILLFCILVILGTLAWALPQSRRENQVQDSQWKTLDGSRPVLLAHRGEKVLLPEHTIPGYETASILGADFVEPDLCLTKDNEFVCHHDLMLAGGTDVAELPEFEDLKKETGDGKFNWFIRDFTLEQLKKLKIIQTKTGVRPQDYNKVFSIPTFDEYLATIHEMTYKLNRTIGIVPELKDPAYHNGDNKNLIENKVLDVFKSHGYPLKKTEVGVCKALVDGQTYDIPCPPVVIQSFQKPPLDYLKTQTDTLELCQLVDNDPTLLTPKGVEEIAKVANYYAPYKEFVYVGVEAQLKHDKVTWDQAEVDALGGFIPAKDFPTEAHKHGLKLVVWTVNDSHEGSTRGCANPGGCEPKNKTQELNYFFDLGVDAVFVENVAESVDILRQYEYSLRGAAGKASLALASFTLILIVKLLL